MQGKQGEKSKGGTVDNSSDSHTWEVYVGSGETSRKKHLIKLLFNNDFFSFRSNFHFVLDIGVFLCDNADTRSA